MSWIEFELRNRDENSLTLNEILDAVYFIDSYGDVNKMRKLLFDNDKTVKDLEKKCDELNKQNEKLEKRHNNLMREQNELIFKLLVELREYAHSTYVRVNLDNESDIIVYRPYDGDLFKKKYIYHFFRVRKDCPRELLCVFDKMRPILEIKQSLNEYILQYCPMEVNKQ